MARRRGSCDLLWEPLAVAALNQPIDVATADDVRRGGPPDARAGSRRCRADPAGARRCRASSSIPAVGVRRAARRRRPCRRRRPGHVRGRPRRRRRDQGRADRRPARSSPRCRGTRSTALCGGDARRALQPTIARAQRHAPARRSSPPTCGSIARCSTLPFVGLPGRTFQWAFDRASSRRARPRYVSLVCSGADRVADLGNEAIVAARPRRAPARPCPASPAPDCCAARRCASVAPPSRWRPASRRARPPATAVPGLLPRRRLDRHRPAGDDRERRHQRPPRRRAPCSTP